MALAKPGALVGGVNWDAPSAAGSTDLVVFQEGSGLTSRNLAAPNFSCVATGTPTWVGTGFGVGSYSTGGAYLGIPEHGSLVAGDLTWRVIVKIISWPGNFTALVDKATPSSQTSREFSIFFDTSGNIDFISIGNGSGGSETVATGLAAGGTYDFVVVRQAGVCTFYVNRQNVGTLSTANVSLSNAFPSVLALGGNPSTGGLAADAVFLLYQTVVGRAWSAAQVAQAYAAPWESFDLPAPTFFLSALPFKTPIQENHRPRPFATDLRTFTNATETQLFGKDQFFAAPGMGPKYDYPNPLRKGQPDRSWFVNLLGGTLAPILRPFAQRDWPLPFAKIFSSTLRTWTAGYTQNKTVNISAGGNIQTAINANAPGTTYILAAGVYRGQSNITPQTGDTLIGDPAGGTIITGGLVLSGWALSSGTYQQTGMPAEVANDGNGIALGTYAFTLHPQDLFVDNVFFKRVSTLGALTSTTWFWDTALNIGYLLNDPTGHTVELNNTRTCFASGGVNVTLQYLTMVHYRNWSGASVFPGDAGWSAYNCIAQYNHGAGFATGPGSTLFGCSALDNGQIGLDGGGGGSDGARILNVEFARNNYAEYDYDWEAGGMKVTASNGVLVRGCYCHDNFGVGLWGDINNSNWIFEYNTVTGNQGAGIMYEISYGTTKIRYNTCTNNGIAGRAGLRANILVQNSQSVEVYSNTVDVNASYGAGIVCTYESRGSGTQGPYDTTNNSIHDNIIIHRGTAGSDLGQDGVALYAAGSFTNTFDFDKYYLFDQSSSYWEFANANFDKTTVVSTALQETHATFGSLADLNPHGATDWPNPRGYYFPTTGHTIFGQAYRFRGLDKFFGAPGQVPENRDWPVPKGPAYLVTLRSWLEGTKLNLRGQDKFFSGPGAGPDYDYPNPRIYTTPLDTRTFLQPVDLLAGQDTFFGAPGQPPANLDRPVPWGPGFLVTLRTWVEGLKQNLLGQDTFYGAPGQGPSYDQPNPQSRTLSTALYSWSASLLQTTLGIIASPFALLDWPNPNGRGFLVDLRSFVNAVELQLFGADTFFGAPGQPPIHDWPNPRVAGQPDRSWFVNLVQSTLAIITAPFALLDWPNPLGRGFLVSLRTFTSAIAFQLFGTDTFFGAPGQPPAHDWPNPRIAGQPERSWFGNLLQSTLAIIAFPFAMLDWPNPRAYLFPTDGRSFLGNLLQSTLGVLKAPFAYFDWPNPRGYFFPIEGRSFLGRAARFIGLDTFFGAPGQVPTNSDQPVPRGYAFLVTLRSWADALKLPLKGQDQFFGAPGEPPVNLDHPVPKGAPFLITLRTWTDALKQNLLGQDRFFGAPGQPPVNTDQPAPRGYTYPAALRTWLVNLVQSTLAFVFPFSLKDWPNPRGAAFLMTLRTWGETLKVNLLGKDKFFGAPGQPPANLDWPVPKGYSFGIALRSWLGSLKIFLVGQRFGVRITNETLTSATIASESLTSASIESETLTTASITNETLE